VTSQVLQEICSEFLNSLNIWHEETGFLDFRELALAEGITIEERLDVRDEYQVHKRRIIINSNQSIYRKRLTVMHEIAHHFFKLFDNGRLTTALRIMFPNNLDIQRQIEETFVERGGFQLTIPNHLLEEVCRNYENDAKRTQILAIKAGCSFAAAGARIAYEFQRPIAGIVTDRAGYVSDFFGNEENKYLKCGRDFTIPEHHPIRQKPFATDRVEYFKAFIPYKKSPKLFSRYMQAVYDDKRQQIIIFFNAPNGNKGQQLRLFSDSS